MQPEQLAADSGAGQMPLRLVPRRGEAIDRGGTVSFSFNGRPYRAFAGDTVASALAAAGVHRLQVSARRTRPRGVQCGAGLCGSCLVQVDGRPNVRACREAVTEGMKVNEQHLGGPSLPALARRVITRLASLEALRRRSPKAAGDAPGGVLDPHEDTRFVNTDVAVIGGGPAGISAALAAAGRGARVALFDENAEVGGHLRFAGIGGGPTRMRPLLELRGALQASSGVEVFNGTGIVDWRADGILALRGLRPLEIRAAAVVVACGAYETPPLFDNNDLPGIMAAGAAQRLLHFHSVAPGRRVAVATCNDAGWETAAALQGAGVDIAAIIDERDSAASSYVGHLQGRVPVHYWHRVLSARGRDRVSGVEIACLDPQGDVVRATAQWVSCDTLIYSRWWTPADELLELGRRTSTPLFAAGRVNGTFALDTQLIEGEYAGQAAAAAAGCGEGAEEAVGAVIDALKEAEPTVVRAEVTAASPRAFACMCEDITGAEAAVAGRLGRGVCRGRMCRAAGKEAPAEGPLRPIALAALRGDGDRGAQSLPLDVRHQAVGARLQVEDGWRQPRDYGDVEAETEAVRRRVGLFDRSALVKLVLADEAGVRLAGESAWHDMPVGTARYGVVRREGGAVVAEALCARRAPGEWYVCAGAGSGPALEAVWGDAATDQSQGWAAFALSGPQAQTVLAGLAPAVPRRFGVWRRQVARIDTWVVGLFYAGYSTFEVHCPAGYAEHVWDALNQAGQARGLVLCGTAALETLRLQRGSVCPERQYVRDRPGGVWLAEEGGTRFLERRVEGGEPLRLVSFILDNAGPTPRAGEPVLDVGDKKAARLVGWVAASRLRGDGRACGLCWLPASRCSNGEAFVLQADGTRYDAQVRYSVWNRP